MHISNLIALFVSVTTAHAACSGPLVIDDFSKWSSNSNSLDNWVSDDASMTSASAANGKLSVVPNANSYFYETFACQAASSNGYNAIAFLVKGPAGASLTLEMQTKSACSVDAYQSYYYFVSGLTGATQTVTIPLSSFPGANTNAITSFVWSGFSTLSTTWEFSKIQFACSASSGSGSTTTSRATSSSQTSRVISLSTVSTSAPAPTGQCANLLIDDWTSQSRLTFLYYNALLNPSSDDGTMASVVVDSTQNRVTYSPKDGSSYFYTQLGCTDANNRFGGISMRLSAPAGTRLSVELDQSWYWMDQTSSHLGTGLPVLIRELVQ